MGAWESTSLAQQFGALCVHGRIQDHEHVCRAQGRQHQVSQNLVKDLHWPWLIMEANVNARFIQHLEYAGFTKEKEVTFPHKQAWFGRLRRECWEGPAL